MRMSTPPVTKASRIVRCSDGERNRLIISTDTGYPAMRSRNVFKCCCARTVVGTRTITCLPACTALKAARSATSVLPKPTSPQMSRSIGLRPLHVALGLLDRAQLARRLGEGERGLELPLPVGVRREREARLRLAARLDAQELGREVHRRPLHRAAGLLPASGPDPAELGLRAAQADVAADEVRFLERDVERDPVVELDRDHLPQALGRVDLGEAAVDGDPVLQVDDEVALDQLGEIEQLVDLGDRDARAAGGARVAAPACARRSRSR